MSTRRNARAGVEDRWHRPARNREAVAYPSDAGLGDAVWCIDPKHGGVGTLVCTGRHGQGQRWQARWVGDGVERSKSFARKADAERHLRRVVADLETGAYADPRRSAVTFGTVAEAWIAAKGANREPKTVSSYRGLLDVVILPKWRVERLCDITHQGLQEWVTWLATNPAARQQPKRAKDKNGDDQIMQTGLSAARVIHAYQVVRQVLAYAVRSKYLAVNVADNIELPRKPQSKDLVLTHTQVRQLADESGDVGAMVRFLAYTGLRFGECIALRVGDVDTMRRRIMVSKSITHAQRYGHMEGGTKTHQRRAVPILTTALNTELATLVADRDPSEYLFPGADGAAMTLGRFRWQFDKAAAKLGLTGVTPHTLRHSAGSLALAAGASVVTVQKLLGHRNATTTMNIYSHMLPDDFDNLAAAMDSAIVNGQKASRI
ncbi:site-specific integrase [Mycolicibacterium sp. BiH015]|uniref:tyrosine-type recombinase/integrase n=1 Tax=Mycolicibacterium sp. BiH015 TaxID=3018808 RepID=UPI0022E075A0|nr:site-specific integrase [Mycolicibacterium sp. BiH015]MDA2895266.1 site-specific integrase [Mycolicibacterium sp. BiH015]